MSPPRKKKRGFFGKLWSFVTGLVYLTIASAIFFALLGIGSFYLVSYIIKGKTNPAPTLVGKSVIVALREIEKNKLSLIYDREETSDLREAGEIIDQNPRPGTPIKDRSPIHVVVSSGARHVVVPDSVVSIDKREAGSRLEQLGLKIGRIARVTVPGKPSNIVLALDPPPGTGVPAGRPINLLVSADLNERLSTIPDLKGYTPDMAREELLRFGLSVDKVTQGATNAVKPGVVFDQTPKPGAGIISGHNVELVVAITPTPEPSPTVVASPTPEPTKAPAIKLDTLERPKHEKKTDEHKDKDKDKDKEPTTEPKDPNAETPAAEPTERSEEDPEPTAKSEEDPEPLHEN